MHHVSILRRVSSSETKTCSLRHFSCNRELKLSIRVLDRLSRIDEMQPYAMLECPLVEHPAALLETVVELIHQQ